VRRLGLLLAFALTIGLVAVATPAQATFPGTNGRIAFGSDRFGGGDHNIFTMNPDGSDVRQLTFLTADQGAALRQAWSPDGSKLVFEQRNTDGSVRQIYMMNADGSNQHLLFSDPSSGDHDPSFSPDGSRVIFGRCPNDFEGCAIYTVKTDGHGLAAVTHFTHGVFDFDPVYSPDGRTIAFTSFNRGGVVAAVYLVNPHGSNLRRITPTGVEGVNPDWSPDGTRIAFQANCCLPQGQDQQIWTMNADGSGLKQLTFPGTQHDSTPSYAPAGDRIAFNRDAEDFSTSSVLTMNADGTDVTTIQTDAFLPSWGSGG
jgi:TolB protein